MRDGDGAEREGATNGREGATDGHEGAIGRLARFAALSARAHLCYNFTGGLNGFMPQSWRFLRGVGGFTHSFVS